MMEFPIKVGSKPILVINFLYELYNSFKDSLNFGKLICSKSIFIDCNPSFSFDISLVSI